MFQAAILAAVLANGPPLRYYFEPPWPWSQEDAWWGVNEVSDAGLCVEVCWFIDGRAEGCSPVLRAKDGKDMCHEKKLARTEGFQMAIDMFVALAQGRGDELREEAEKAQGKRPRGLLSQREQVYLHTLEARQHENHVILERLQAEIERTPQEVQPAKELGENQQEENSDAEARQK